ncbi:hypothetical protein [Butyrivibrio sp. MC2013]|uniref:hypothetical protein n=1 Tax=Butyrivibrio sp. MC2013 TaxID=1280686 RepID=UPI0012DD5D28|nr:hypothetical protein [Butyrivibrio sp. MC2013]
MESYRVICGIFCSLLLWQLVEEKGAFCGRKKSYLWRKMGKKSLFEEIFRAPWSYTPKSSTSLAKNSNFNSILFHHKDYFYIGKGFKYAIFVMTP